MLKFYTLFLLKKLHAWFLVRITNNPMKLDLDALKIFQSLTLLVKLYHIEIKNS